jgi:uncharacterized protein (TIGR02145 family)
VKISTDGGVNYQNYGSITYSEKPTLASCDTTSMQTFGAGAANCKAAMKQGQVIVLNDPRGNSDSPNGQKYRVKKMPDGNVWMIDNLKLGSTTSTTALTPSNTNITANYTLPIIDGSVNNADPSSTTYCAAGGSVWTHTPGSLTGCGYLYNWATAIAGTASESGFSISAKGWNLTKNAGDMSYFSLQNAMIQTASDIVGGRNPIYSTTAYKNFVNLNPPFQAVFAGIDQGDITFQGTIGFYWSGSQNPNPVDYPTKACYLYLNPTTTDPQNCGRDKASGQTVRSVL